MDLMVTTYTSSATFLSSSPSSSFSMCTLISDSRLLVPWKVYSSVKPFPPKPRYPQNLRSPSGFPQVCCPSWGSAPRADWGRGGVVARQIVCNPPTPVTERAQHSQALAVGAAGEGCLSCACLARDGYDQVQYYSRKCGYDQCSSWKDEYGVVQYPSDKD